jgi:hypothetical protein
MFRLSPQEKSSAPPGVLGDALRRASERLTGELTAAA